MSACFSNHHSEFIEDSVCIGTGKFRHQRREKSRLTLDLRVKVVLVMNKKFQALTTGQIQGITEGVPLDTSPM